jgi:hypothetical protein
MPCRNDMSPSAAEYEIRALAQHLSYVDGALALPTSARVHAAALCTYGDAKLLHGFTAELCGKIKGMSPEELDRIVYDGRNAQARALADWWDAHQAADAKREAGLRETARKTALIASAKAKLTAEELDALTRGH